MATIKTSNTPGPDGHYSSLFSNLSESSPRVSGKLVLTTNEHTMLRSQLAKYSSSNDPRVQTARALGAENWVAWGITSSQENELRARFNRQLQQGNASLGMTAATWRQSAGMITSRSGKLLDFFTSVGRSAQKSPALRRQISKRGLNTRAGDILEGYFGWVPLFQDMSSLALTAFSNAIPPTWISVKSDAHYYETSVYGDPQYSFQKDVRYGKTRATYSSGVQVSNPNLWIANRLGLINLAGVAWDAVPWSFVVNMFVNTNQLISSLTDYVGLELLGGSLTTTCTASRNYYESHSGQIWTGKVTNDGMLEFITVVNTAGSLTVSKHKSRVLRGSPPKPSLQFRLPNVGLDLAIIGSALVTQKVTTLALRKS